MKQKLVLLSPQRLPRTFAGLTAGLVLTLSLVSAACAQEKSAAAPPASTLLSHAWLSVGPDGGDARSLAPDPRNPQHLYLGTTSSWVYDTTDGGAHWERLAKLGTTDDLVVDNIFVDSSDPKTLVAGVWKLTERGGGIFISHDGGHLWKPVADMNGQSVRALTQAPSNPKMYVAGTLSGVYRSMDGGETWQEISPAGSTELHEIESVAIDPMDTNTIYAGTWHLPWKTTDGGAHWANIKQGLIDDSDVFSIIIDPKEPSVIYASACSGIYKSISGGSLFRKVQGIPSTARRTQILMQDPTNRNIVYAGTTQGLYKTTDAGENWVRLTGSDVIVNDLFVDPANDQRVLMATARSGMLASNDGGKSFTSSNDGFSQRLVQTLLADHSQPNTLYAGVLNDKMYGGAFVSHDGGRSWTQDSDGLAGRDVFTLAQTADGSIYAGTNDGMMKLAGDRWVSAGGLVRDDERKVTAYVHHHREVRTVHHVTQDGTIEGRVNGLDLDGPVWFAATSHGVYRSADSGATWQATTLNAADYPYLDAEGDGVIAGQRNSLMLSSDRGTNWKPIPLPAPLSGVAAVTISGDGAVWVGGREGVYFTRDAGATWNQIRNLPLGGINSLSYDAALHRVLATSATSTSIFGLDDQDSAWKYWNAGWLVHQVLQQGNRLVAASLYDGVVLQPAPEAPASQEASAVEPASPRH